MDRSLNKYMTSIAEARQGNSADAAQVRPPTALEELGGKLNGIAMGLADALGEIGGTLDGIASQPPEAAEKELRAAGGGYCGSLGQLFELADKLESLARRAHDLKLRLQRIA